MIFYHSTWQHIEYTKIKAMFYGKKPLMKTLSQLQHQWTCQKSLTVSLMIY